MEPKKCFVIMSFKPNYDLVYENGIKKAVSENGLMCVRIDQDFTPQNIPTNIINGIIEADLIIADVTEASPNVYYELGISHSVGNKTIIISQDLKNHPFDIRNENTLKYNNTRDSIRLLYFDLKECISVLINRPNIPSNIVQIAGHKFFDLRGQIIENLHLLNEERNRVIAFNKYMMNDRLTSNDKIISDLAKSLAKKMSPPFFVSICGGAGLGKTTMSEELYKFITTSFSDISVSILPLDAFMMDRTERTIKNVSGYHIDANNIAEAKKSILGLMDGREIEIYPYNHQTGEHDKQPMTVSPGDIVFVDGIHSFHPKLLRYISFKIFLYATPADSKELRFLTDIFDRRYHPKRAFRHAEEEYKFYEEHVLHYIKISDMIITINNYWEYSIC